MLLLCNHIQGGPKQQATKFHNFKLQQINSEWRILKLFKQANAVVIALQWLGSVVARAADLWSADREFDSRPVHCQVA